MKEVGLFFGSFNPVHQGHLMLANYMLSFVPLDEVWFIISPHNPLKTAAELWPEAFRLKLLHKATEGFESFKVNDIEFGMSKPSYTIDTLNLLLNQYPSIHFSLILGSDSLQSLEQWKTYKSILERVKLLVYPRKGSDGGALRNHPAVKWVNAPLLEVSSTFIRKSLSSGKDIQYFMPHGVSEMISEWQKTSGRITG